MVLNGGSSSGKSEIVRSLQGLLPEPWLAFGVDDFVEALPAAMQSDPDGIEFATDGGVVIGAEFRRLEAVWVTGVVAMVNAGGRVIVDDVFLGGAHSQRRWLEAAGELPVLWVGVRCSPEVAAAREVARGDRVAGMAVRQAHVVHVGVRYDVEVDTTDASSVACARRIAALL